VVGAERGSRTVALWRAALVRKPPRTHSFLHIAETDCVAEERSPDRTGLNQFRPSWTDFGAESESIFNGLQDNSLRNGTGK
jgi:hypothetical protein